MKNFIICLLCLVVSVQLFANQNILFNDSSKFEKKIDSCMKEIKLKKGKLLKKIEGNGIVENYCVDRSGTEIINVSITEKGVAYNRRYSSFYYSNNQLFYVQIITHSNRKKKGGIYYFENDTLMSTKGISLTDNELKELVEKSKQYLTKSLAFLN